MEIDRRVPSISNVFRAECAMVVRSSVDSPPHCLFRWTALHSPRADKDRRQGMFMPRCRDRLLGALAPVLTAPTLSAIRDLNREYLELLIADREARRFARSLPQAVVDGLANLNVSARRAIAACPFALFSLGLEQQDFWRIAAGPRGIAEEAPSYQALTSLSAESCFSIGALFFAWHVASTQRTAARVCFAMPDGVVASLAGLRLSDLRRIAFDSPT
jgi:hypothetical protein